MCICTLFLLPCLLLLFSRAVSHDIFYAVACFENGTTEVQLEFDAEEVFYVDFQRHEVVYTVPRFLMKDPEKIFETFNVYRDAMKGKAACSAVLAFCKAEEKNPPEETDPPQNVLYPSEEVQPGVENTLICFVDHFYPPDIRVSWTKNGDLVSEGVSLSRYYPNSDQTFHQFSTLMFTPREGDIYSCTVEHLALKRPLTKFWEPEFSHPGVEADIFCGVGLSLGLLGVAAGTFLMVKGHHGG